MSHNWRYICLANSFKWPEVEHFDHSFVHSINMHSLNTYCMPGPGEKMAFLESHAFLFPPSLPSLRLVWFMTSGTKGWGTDTAQFMVPHQSWARQGPSFFCLLIHLFLCISKAHSHSPPCKGNHSSAVNVYLFVCMYFCKMCIVSCEYILIHFNGELLYSLFGILFLLPILWF